MFVNEEDFMKVYKFLQICRATGYITEDLLLIFDNLMRDHVTLKKMVERMRLEEVVDTDNHLEES